MTTLKTEAPRTLVVDDPLEGIIHQTALAAHVARGGRAVDELLLGQRGEGARLEEGRTLDGARRGE